MIGRIQATLRNFSKNFRTSNPNKLASFITDLNPIGAADCISATATQWIQIQGSYWYYEIYTKFQRFNHARCTTVQCSCAF